MRFPAKNLREREREMVGAEARERERDGWEERDGEGTALGRVGGLEGGSLGEISKKFAYVCDNTCGGCNFH